MSETLDQTLADIFELIEDEKLVEARSALAPLLKSHKDNTEVWWLYAHAVEDTDRAQQALQNVLRLDPEHPEAGDLLQAIHQQSSPDIGDDELVDDADLDFDDGDFDEDFDEEMEQPPQQRGLLFRLVGMLIVTVIVVAVAFLLTSLGGDSEEPVVSTPTLAAQIGATNTPWPLASPEVTISPTEVDTIIDTPSPFAAMVDALEGFQLYAPVETIVETELGNTVLVAVCIDANETQRVTLNNAMAAAVTAINSLPDGIDAFGVQLVDCSADLIFNVIAVDRDHAEAFLNNTLTEEEFRSHWRAVR